MRDDCLKAISDEGPSTDVGVAVLERMRANNKPTLHNQTGKQKATMNKERQIKINEKMKWAWGGCEEARRGRPERG